jgi:hypothetical protein
MSCVAVLQNFTDFLLCFLATAGFALYQPLSNKKSSRRLGSLRDDRFHQTESLVMMNNGVISKLSNFGRNRSLL